MLTRSSGGEKLVVPPLKESMRKKHLVRKVKKAGEAADFKPANVEHHVFVPPPAPLVAPPADDGRPEAGTERSLAFRAHVVEAGGQTSVPPDFCWGEPTYDRPVTPEPVSPSRVGPVFHVTWPTYSPTSPPH